MRGMIRAYAAATGEPPAEVKLWNAGDNPTDYGVHRWTQRSAALVLADYQKRGNPIALDVEHLGAEAPEGSPPPTAGYARLELRNGEPWLVFDWSAYAQDQIRTRQRLFLSPEYNVDKATGEILQLIRVSLVADPGTHHARMLASRAKGQSMNDDIQSALDALKAGDVKKCQAILEGLLSDAQSPDAPPAPGARVGARRAMLPPDEARMLAGRMGLQFEAPRVRRDGCRVAFQTMTAEQSRAHLATRGRR